MITPKNLRFFRSVLALLMGIALPAISPAETPAQPLPGLIYHPEGDAIAIKNGERWENRPLYCHER